MGTLLIFKTIFSFVTPLLAIFLNQRRLSGPSSFLEEIQTIICTANYCLIPEVDKPSIVDHIQNSLDPF